MRFDRLDLNLLVALDALLAERNISRAAEQVHLSQSAMSNALARLREYFGDELLVPVKRRMELTPRALALREPVHDLLARIRITLAVQPEFEPRGSERLFNVVASDYTLETVLPHLVALAGEQGSTVRFRFLPLMGSPTQALENADADLLVIPDLHCSREHPAELLLHEEFVCVAWQGSVHAREGLGLERYREAGHVVMEPLQSGAVAYESRFMERMGVQRHVAVATYGFSSLPSLVVGTECVATLHARLARRMARHLPLVLLPVPVAIPTMSLMMQWHQHRSQDPALLWLRALMLQAVARLDDGPALDPAKG